MRKKMDTRLDVLCKGFPEEFKSYLRYCRGLEFEDKPDYEYLRRIFRSLYDSLGYENDFIYDWTRLGKGKKRAVGETKKAEGTGLVASKEEPVH